MLTEGLGEALRAAAEDPVWQAVLAGAATFVLEDPVTVTCGLLVAAGEMPFPAAAIGLSVGIALGDLGLYGLGWLAARGSLRWRVVSPERLAQGRGWVERNLVMAVTVARFVPGMRIPCYAGAGAVGAPLWKFALVVAGASAVWTLLLLRLTAALGGAVLPLLAEWRWPVTGASVAMLALVQWMIARRARAPRPEPVVSMFEFWPPWLFYIPVVLHYMWLALRYRSVALPTAANPSIYSGGVVKESKAQILSLIPAHWSGHTLPFVLWRRPEGAGPPLLASARAAAEAAGIALPFVAKPDEGQRGDGVQLIRTWEQLGEYAAKVPPGMAILFQRLARWTPEAGVFYVRRPGRGGEIISITLKEFPHVKGDGKRTLRELIMADARARRLAQVYLRRHAAELDRVPAAGEEKRLVFAGNHCQGAVFRDGTSLATPAMAAAFDAIARSMEGFHFGRFDVKYRDIEALRRGEDFEIMEVNGASAESTHIWDARVTLWEAYASLFRQFSLLFEIGDANRRAGATVLSGRQVWRDFLEYRAQARKYPRTD